MAGRSYWSWRFWMFMRRQRAYFEPMAILEASVSILSGVLLWIGFWDATSYIIAFMHADHWAARVLLILGGVVGLFLSRTLYDKQMLQAIRAARPDSAALQSFPSRASGQPMLGAGLAMERVRPAAELVARLETPAEGFGIPVEGSGQPGPSSTGSEGEIGRIVFVSPSDSPQSEAGQPLSGQPLPLRGAAKAAAPVYAAAAPPHIIPEGAAGSGAGGPQADRPAHSVPQLRTAAQPKAHAPPAGVPPAARQYFRAPRFELSKFCRSLGAILCGLAVWVGLWDLIDYDIIPALFDACHDDRLPSLGCLLVKLVLGILGAGGLFATRSLYGDTQVKSAQFSRFE
ncbi:hypothetical protein EMIHUDRAFT_118358 [Emiliania huxleyi CCMP1516]|uniref:Uncharacterized protein n=2 Tax=Emiliania huxleyi TaxID=2903 RepID=A0A0D3J524_EMIH1|nr:hypothetical protein EMIHUDRAFT_118358 [Emiliania huxleyi CCMP1516]EOD18609.1 hypothetical protein EMIHUDRAFT_118358 [Emiliania huxleyi CCMP1516]|eukprot:XP_005771038.1 hypothetical protein EMIHUDRAFT_118358 [Emiliania huxleyi CCMP1516]